jgi:antitoxin component YwqK of YwqJK toxin-antitoxin module
MNQRLFLFLFLLHFVSYGQTIKADNFQDINYKDVTEIKSLIYIKADTTLVSGKVIRYNKKKEAKSYILVTNGKPDSFGWIYINDKYKEPEKKMKTKTTPVVNEAGIIIGSVEEPLIKYYDQMSDRNDITKSIQSNIDASVLEKPRDRSYEDEVLKNKGINDEVDKNGILEKYYSNGNLESKGVYIDGKKDGLWQEYYDNSQLKSKGNYIKGKKDDFWQEYHKNGQLLGSINYKDGKENGIMEVYHNNGQLMMKGVFRDAIQIGEWKYYNENGELIKTENLGN